MKHHDLWNDSLDAAMPRDLAAASLKAMQSAGRRRKRRRRITSAALVCATGALALWPATRTPQPEPVTAAVAITAQAPASPVHYLSDAELIEHLNSAGYGVAVMQQGGHERALLVPRVMRSVPGHRR